MKRITWWPQLFLGLAFSWGALVGWTSQTGAISFAPLLLYLGAILWVIGYDTIYALQDVEDDALVGRQVHGAAVRRAGEAGRVALFYALAIACWIVAAFQAGASYVFVVALIVPAAILVWQVATLDHQESGQRAGALQGQPLGRPGADARVPRRRLSLKQSGADGAVCELGLVALVEGQRGALAGEEAGHP